MVDYREIIWLKSTKPEISNTMIDSSAGSSRNAVLETGPQGREAYARL